MDWIVARCQNCIINRPSTTRAPLQPIEVTRTFEQVQIDLIDMKHKPSDQYKWILHAKDHFSKYSWLYALKSKESEPITRAMEQWLMAFGPLKIIQCNNGTKFKGALLLVLKRHGIKLINSNPRSPQTQRLVEQANGVVENKMKAWKIENGSTLWHEALLEVALAINMQVYSATNQSPYNVLFRQPFNAVTWMTQFERQSATQPGQFFYILNMTFHLTDVVS